MKKTSIVIYPKLIEFPPLQPLSTDVVGSKESLPTIFGIPIIGYYDREISYKDLVSMSCNRSIDLELRSHYKQMIMNLHKSMKNFNCGMKRFIILQNPTTCKIRLWFD